MSLFQCQHGADLFFGLILEDPTMYLDTTQWIAVEAAVRSYYQDQWLRLFDKIARLRVILMVVVILAVPLLAWMMPLGWPYWTVLACGLGLIEVASRVGGRKLREVLEHKELRIRLAEIGNTPVSPEEQEMFLQLCGHILLRNQQETDRLVVQAMKTTGLSQLQFIQDVHNGIRELSALERSL